MAAPASELNKTDEVTYAVADYIATITFNRPEKQNTISAPMLSALTDMLVAANEDTDVRAIVITGSGKFFCAGLDLRGGGIASGLSNQQNSPTNLDLRTAPPIVLHSIDKPTICALNGSAAG
ncbi:MAG: enoyl-CoA hydratase/isomerase family protein, partial [Pseudomonadales bacterium]